MTYRLQTCVSKLSYKIVFIQFIKKKATKIKLQQQLYKIYFLCSNKIYKKQKMLLLKMCIKFYVLSFC